MDRQISKLSKEMGKMKLKPIISSLLETDLYKFNMGNVIFKRFNDYKTTWTFKCRNSDVKFASDMVMEIKSQIDRYCTLSFMHHELEWLKDTCPWLSEGYVNYLKFWHPIRSEIFVNEKGGVPYNDCGLSIEAKGTWLNTSMYEIAILAIVNEVYFSMQYNRDMLFGDFKARTMEKIDGILGEIGNQEYAPITFSEFGMRRRLSADSQDWLIGTLKCSLDNKQFLGTSNVYLAYKHGIKTVGTMAHEFVQCVGQGNHEHNPAYSNKFAMKAWTDEYQTRNGIVLGDTITTDCFLRDFDLTYATLFGGVRHDSGDPIEWGEKIIGHYECLGIDPSTKLLLFSDSLNFAKATEIYNHFDGRTKIAFGIGTYLANDTSKKPLNIVMKVTECNGSPVAKLSDVEGKGMCRDSKYVDYLRRTISWRMNH